MGRKNPMCNFVFMKELYTRIKVRREQIGYTQKYMSDELNIDPATYSRIENGRVDITLSRLENIAKLLQIDLITLLAGDAISELKINNPKVTLLIELDDRVKADVVSLAFGSRVITIKK